MPKEQSRIALKRAAVITAALSAFWFLGALLAQAPTVRDVERQLDRHVAEANLETTHARISRIEAAVETNTEQLWLLRGGGSSLALILIGLNVLNLVGWKVNLTRSKRQ